MTTYGDGATTIPAHVLEHTAAEDAYAESVAQDPGCVTASFTSAESPTKGVNGWARIKTSRCLDRDQRPPNGRAPMPFRHSGLAFTSLRTVRRCQFKTSTARISGRPRRRGSRRSSHGRAMFRRPSPRPHRTTRSVPRTRTRSSIRTSTLRRRHSRRTGRSGRTWRRRPTRWTRPCASATGPRRNHYSPNCQRLSNVST
jgi:hypothetical protein